MLAHALIKKLHRELTASARVALATQVQRETAWPPTSETPAAILRRSGDTGARFDACPLRDGVVVSNWEALGVRA